MSKVSSQSTTPKNATITGTAQANQATHHTQVSESPETEAVPQPQPARDGTAGQVVGQQAPDVTYVITAGPNYEQLELSMRNARHGCPTVVQLMVMPCIVRDDVKDSRHLKLTPMLTKEVPLFARVLGIQREMQMEGVRLTLFVQDRIYLSEPVSEYADTPIPYVPTKRQRVTASYNFERCTGGIAFYPHEPLITSQHHLRLWDIGDGASFHTDKIDPAKVSTDFTMLGRGWNSGYYVANQLKTRQ